ncbi:MAG: sulfur carrier protein ThiS adenylyltransferase ThiF [Candidatus Omnitrophota bacterium]
MNTFTRGLLKYLTSQQLAAIESTRIGIGGAGGLGSNVAVILARTGFRHFEIIDKDTVEASNLNRQDFSLEDIGRIKVDALKERILSINPQAHLITHHAVWDENKGATLFTDCSVIVEAFDQAEEKTHFVDFYHGRAPYIISGNGMAGLHLTKELSVRKTGNIYFVGDGETSVSHNHPPLAPRVMECAAKMASTILNLTI